MDPTQAPNRAEAERHLDIAAKLLASRDLVGAKRFADLAIAADPNFSDDRADQILAVADVLLATHKRINNHLDWYQIIQLPPNPNPSFDLDLLRRRHRGLSLLLHPDRNRLPGADAAFRLVADAFNVLSDPSKRSLFDAEVKMSKNLFSSSSASASDEPSFWTLCSSCCYVHLYSRAYLGKTLKCQTCGKGFSAVELQTQPSIVPGTDMYYATWGFFPLGFANPGSSEWKPFVEVTPGSGNGGGPQQNPPPGDGPVNGGGSGPGPGPGHEPVVSTGRKKKTMARKKVMSGIKNRVFGHHVENAGNFVQEEAPKGNVAGEGKEEEEARGININEAAKGVGEEDNIDMIIDLDATNDMLGNLHNLPFLKEDGINIQFP